MLILFRKSQATLFDTPVLVQGSVHKDGKVVRPHVRIQKKRLPEAHGQQVSLFDHEPAPAAAKRTKLEAFVAKQGGLRSLASKLSALNEGQQQILLEKMAALDGKTVADVSAMFDGASQEKGETLDLFGEAPAKDVAPKGIDTGAVFDLKSQYEKMNSGQWKVYNQDADFYYMHKVGAKVPNQSNSATLPKASLHAAIEAGTAKKVDAAPEPKDVTPPSLDLPVIEHDGDTWHVVNTGAARDDGKIYAHLSSTTRGRHAKNGVQPVQMADWVDRDKLGMSPPEAAPEIVEHVTKKGKTLRGVIRQDLTQDEAKEIDAYTFRKDGGWFIREKHLGEAKQAPATAKPPPVAREPIKQTDPLAFGVPAGITKAERRRLNAAAAALVEDKLPGEMTNADRDLLRQYSGNGGCGDSLNEFYTDPAVAASMWAVAASLGIKSGTALEPSCGTGVFLHTAPEGFKVTGVEMETTSSKIADALHGDRHEIQQASLERFATQDMRQFDVVIGNPPYGPRGSLARDDKKDLSKAEEYFIDTSLDKTRPGGLCMLVVPAGIMNSKNGRKFRERMLRKGEFLGAQRMPNSAFEASHTDVTADVIYLRKRPDDVAGALGAVDKKTLKAIGVWDDEFLAGGYFEGRGASNVFGTVGTAMRAFGEIYAVTGSMQGVAAAIAEFQPDPVGATPAVTDILAAAPNGDRSKILNAAEKRPYQDGAKVGDTRVVDGVTYVLQGKPPRWHRVDEALQSEAVTTAQQLAAEIERLMTGQVADRPQLEADIKAWVGQHGLPSKHPHLLIAASADKSLYRLIGAVDKDGRLSDVVAGRQSKREEGGFDAVATSLALGHETGDFSVAELAEALGKDGDEVLDHLSADSRYAWTGGDRWAPMDAYLTGDLWQRLDAVKAMLAGDTDAAMRPKLEDQQRRLEQAIDPKSLEDVDISLNSAFLPMNVIEAWIDSRTENLRASMPNSTYYQNLSAASVTFDKGVYKIGSNTGINEGLLDKYLNRTGVRKDDLGTIEAWNEDFKDWLCASQYRDFVEDLYNRKFRGFVQREYSDEPIDIPGLANLDKIKGFQWPGLRWALAAGKGIIAADVGLGKTLRGLLLARMAKITGKAQKPMIVVPKSVLANWYAETQKWFPDAKVLTIGGTFAYNAAGDMVGRDDAAAERKRKLHDLTQNDYDFVIISEESFQEVDLDPATKNDMYSNDFWVQRGDSLGNAGDKRVKKVREAYEQSIAKREFSERTDAIYFNDLNVDMIIADEMHHQKNLYAAKSRFGETPKFLGGQGLSNRALDFNLKSRWLLNAHGNKGVYGLTATPTKNSPLEIYSMLSHIAPEAFENIGIRNSEEFLDRFCKFETDHVLSTKGEVETALVTAGFKNMDELREIMRKYIDRTTAEQVGLVLPARDDRMHMVDMSPEQQAVYVELREAAAKSAEKDSTGDAHIFSVMDKMNKAALDLEILDPEMHAGHKSPKYKELAKQVMVNVKEGGQIVFSDYIDSHEKIVDHLVAAGIPRDQIGVINAKAASTAVKRQNIADNQLREAESGDRQHRHHGGRHKPTDGHYGHPPHGSAVGTRQHATAQWSRPAPGQYQRIRADPHLSVQRLV